MKNELKKLISRYGYEMIIRELAIMTENEKHGGIVGYYEFSNAAEFLDRAANHVANGQRNNRVLKDFLPQLDTPIKWLEDHANWKIVEEWGGLLSYKKWPGTHRNVKAWCIIQMGNTRYAVGWNENPSIGWSFPYMKIEGTMHE